MAFCDQIDLVMSGHNAYENKLWRSRYYLASVIELIIEGGADITKLLMIELINEGYAETTSAYGIKLGIEGEADIWLIKIILIFEEEALFRSILIMVG